MSAVGYDDDDDNIFAVEFVSLPSFPVCKNHYLTLSLALLLLLLLLDKTLHKSDEKIRRKFFKLKREQFKECAIPSKVL